MIDIKNLTISEARELLKSKSISAKELTEAYLKRIKSSSKLNAYCLVDEENALKQAAVSDITLKSKTTPSMCGIPIGVKDLFCTKGIKTQAASKILEGFIPSYESTVTQKLWDAGSVMLGKLNMDEFAMGSSNETSVYGPVTSPWRSQDEVSLTPGGSSGGCSAAVAADLCLAAIGTDTGGSIRQPAAFTGIVGLKPTYGRCSRWGVIAFASSLDQAGSLTKTVRDSAIILETISGFDTKDSTSGQHAVPNFEQMLTGDIRKKKIGVPKEYKIDDTPEEIEKLWTDGIAKLSDAGAEIVEISLPHTRYALPTYYVLAPAEASSNLARYDGIRYGKRATISETEGSRSEGFGKEVKRRIMLGTYVLSAGFYEAYYIRAQKVRMLIKNDFDTVFSQGIDAILTPTAPSAAFPLGEKIDKSPIEMYLNDIFTVPANLAGLPGISIPSGLDKKGLPLGLQLIGKSWNEGELLNIAYRLEQDTGFNIKPKCWWE